MLSLHRVILAMLVVGVATTAQAASADTPLSLTNLERERAALLRTLFDPSLSPSSRQHKQAGHIRKLTDLERMVLRDERLLENANANVKRAFAEYDRTFLVHASAEKGQSVTLHWLSQIGFTADAIDQAKMGVRP